MKNIFKFTLLSLLFLSSFAANAQTTINSEGWYRIGTTTASDADGTFVLTDVQANNALKIYNSVNYTSFMTKKRSLFVRGEQNYNGNIFKKLRFVQKSVNDPIYVETYIVPNSGQTTTVAMDAGTMTALTVIDFTPGSIPADYDKTVYDVEGLEFETWAYPAIVNASSEGGGGDPTDELQNLAISGQQLSISNGNSVTLPGTTASTWQEVINEQSNNDPSVSINMRDDVDEFYWDLPSADFYDEGDGFLYCEAALGMNYSGGQSSFSLGNGANSNKFNDGRTVKKGWEYGADYSANYTDRSLVDKAYVDNSVSSAGGGTLQQAIDEQLNQKGEYFLTASPGSDLEFGFEMPSSSWFDDGVGNLSINADSEVGFQSNGSYFRVGNSQNSFQDGRAVKKGIEYKADYSANYTDRSLIDKGFVKGGNIEADEIDWSNVPFFADNDTAYAVLGVNKPFKYDGSTATPKGIVAITYIPPNAQ